MVFLILYATFVDATPTNKMQRRDESNVPYNPRTERKKCVEGMIVNGCMCLGQTQWGCK